MEDYKENQMDYVGNHTGATRGARHAENARPDRVARHMHEF